jgi:hypothetical protein
MMGGGSLLGGVSGMPAPGPAVAHPGLVGTSCQFVDGSGLTVRGSFSDDHFRLMFRLGTPDALVCHPRRPVTIGYPWWTPVHSFGVYDPFYSDYGYTRYVAVGGAYEGYYDPALVWPGYRAPAPQPAEPEPVPPTDRKIGDQALRQGSAEEAVAAYRRHLDQEPGDAEVMRLLGVALIDARHTKEGVAMIGMAYRKDAGLCGHPLPRDVLGERRGDLRASLNRVSIFANQSGAASAWLALGVLAQAEGRPEVARRAIERARDAGLDPALAARFLAAVSR